MASHGPNVVLACISCLVLLDIRVFMQAGKVDFWGHALWRKGRRHVRMAYWEGEGEAMAWQNWVGGSMPCWHVD